MKKLIFIFILICLTFFPSFSLAQNPGIPEPAPGARPNDCGDQCVTFSDDGNQIHLYYKSGHTPTDDTFDYVSISEYINKWIADYLNYSNIYIFRARRDNSPYARSFYVLFAEAGADQSNETWIVAYYQTGENREWNKGPQKGELFKVIGNAHIPTGVKDNERYSWRIVISGKVEFESGGTKVPAKEAHLQIRMDNEKGPNIGEIQTNDQGDFEYSGVSTFVNDNTVNNLYLYTKYDHTDGLKYESWDSILYLDNQWHTNEKDNESKVRGGVSITLNDKNKTDKYWDPTNGPGQTLKQELFGPNAQGGLWQNVLRAVICAIRNFFIGAFYVLAKIAAYFLRKNY